MFPDVTVATVDLKHVVRDFAAQVGAERLDNRRQQLDQLAVCLSRCSVNLAAINRDSSPDRQATHSLNE